MIWLFKALSCFIFILTGYCSNEETRDRKNKSKRKTFLDPFGSEARIRERAGSSRRWLDKHDNTDTSGSGWWVLWLLELSGRNCSFSKDTKKLKDKLGDGVLGQREIGRRHWRDECKEGHLYKNKKGEFSQTAFGRKPSGFEPTLLENRTKAMGRRDRIIGEPGYAHFPRQPKWSSCKC